VSDLTEFLAARFAEDWSAARDRELALGLDESRATRDVDAKRDILRWHAAQCTCSWCTADGDDLDETGFAPACPTLCFLAAIYSDHPDYRPEWSVPSVVPG
jgi:hypothetical protein